MSTINRRRSASTTVVKLSDVRAQRALDQDERWADRYGDAFGLVADLSEVICRCDREDKSVPSEFTRDLQALVAKWEAR